MSSTSLSDAVRVLREGGVIAYPTEYCFGLGCDPRNSAAVRRILKIKQRAEAQGLILVAASTAQVEEYAILTGLERQEQIVSSWPGPTTWILPVTARTPSWIHGDHQSVAMRVTAHPLVSALCHQFGGAIVSTSANRHARPSLLQTSDVIAELGEELDFIVDGPLGATTPTQSASSIFDAISGEQLR